MLRRLIDRTVVRARRVARALSMRESEWISEVNPVPPIVDDPMEALFETQGGRPTSFRCPVDRCTHFVGFGFAPSGWHPFVATLEEYRSGWSDRYEGSLLEAYYQAWQPGSAREALAGFDKEVPALEALPPHCFYLTPWTAFTAEEITADIRYWSDMENAEHGSPHLNFLEHGLGYFGPAHPSKGRMEFDRLIGIHDRLEAEGYDRTVGDVTVRVLERGSELRFVVDGGGYHRTAAMAAAGHSFVPARLRGPFTINTDDAGSWPQVRRGIWPRSTAVAYFHHLFEFDSRGWARARGLLPEPGQRPGGEEKDSSPAGFEARGSTPGWAPSRGPS